MNLEKLKEKLLQISGVVDVEVKEEDRDSAVLLLTVKNFTPKLGLSVASIIGKELGNTFLKEGDVPEIDWEYRVVN